MNILVTGADGQLGREIKNRVEKIGNGRPDHFVGEPNYYIFAGRNELDITDENAVMKYTKDNHINVVVNCAAYTNVEKAQEDRDNAYNVNALGPMYLADAMNKCGGLLIHISTDYVFKSVGRSVPVPPVSIGENVIEYPDADRDECFYGYSKGIGEHLIQQVKGARYIIIRTSWLYSEYGKNFVNTMAERAIDRKVTKVVNDQTGSPTYAGDLADFILHIIENNNSDTRYLSKTGIYNFSNKGFATWYAFAKEIFIHLAGENETARILGPCDSKEFKSNVVRPSYSVLDVKKTEDAFGYKIRYWHDALIDSAIDKIEKEIKKRRNQIKMMLDLENTEYDYGHNVDMKKNYSED